MSNALYVIRGKVRIPATPKVVQQRRYTGVGEEMQRRFMRCVTVLHYTFADSRWHWASMPSYLVVSTTERERERERERGQQPLLPTCTTGSRGSRGKICPFPSALHLTYTLCSLQQSYSRRDREKPLSLEETAQLERGAWLLTRA